MVIAFKFQNNATDPDPVNLENTRLLWFSDTDSVKRFFEESSYGRVRLSGDVFGTYTIPLSVDVSTTSCFRETRLTWSELALNEARNRGVNVDNYDYKVFIHPRLDRWEAFCGYGGIADIGTRYNWINAYNETEIFAHELGHSFFLNHAASLDCQGAAIAEHYCFEYEYGDPYDVMGISYNSRPKHFNAPHRIEAGWISNNEIQSIENDGIYTVRLKTLEGLSGGIKTVKIPRNVTSIHSSFNRYYYLEYRQQTGFDQDLPDQATRGVLIHTFEELNSFNKTKLIDLTPISQDSDFLDSTLEDNRTFVDEFNRISIKQISHNSDEVVVEINMGLVSPSPSPTPQPSPTLTPSATPPPISLTLDNNIVVAGTTINVAWNNLNNGLEKDWAAIFKQSDPSEARYFKEWLFLGNCSRQSQGRIPGSSGSCSIKIPDNLPVGIYEVRLMTNNTYNVVATSQSLIIGGGDNFIVSVSPNPVRPGQTVNLSWSGIPTHQEKDWVGMFKVNDPASAGYLKEWMFLATCSRQSRTDYVPGPAGNCTLTIPSNLSQGEYNFRFMTDNLYQVTGTSRSINVSR